MKASHLEAVARAAVLFSWMGITGCAGAWTAISRPVPTVPSAGWTSSTNLKDGEQIVIGPVTFGAAGTSIGIFFQELPDGDRWSWPIPIDRNDHALAFTSAAQNRFQELVIGVPTRSGVQHAVRILKQDGTNPTRYLEEATLHTPNATPTGAPTQAALLRQPNGRLVLLVVDQGLLFCAAATNDQGTAFSGLGFLTYPVHHIKGLVNRQGRIGIFSNVVVDTSSPNPAGGDIRYLGQTQADAGCSFKVPVILGGFAYWRLDAGIDGTGRFQVFSHNRFAGESRLQMIRQLNENDDLHWGSPVFLSPGDQHYAFPAVITDSREHIVIAAEGPSGIEIASQVNPQSDPAEYTPWWPMGGRLPNGSSIHIPFWGKHRDGRLTLFGFNQTDHLYYARSQRAPGSW